MPRRLALLALTTIHLGACYSWTPSHIAPPTLVEVERPKAIRVRSAQGREVVLLNPVIRSDSIFETGLRCTGGTCVERTGTVALREVVEVDGRSFSAAKTIGASLLGLFAVLTVAVAATGGVLGSGPF